VRKIGLRLGSRNTCGNLKKGQSRRPKTLSPGQEFQYTDSLENPASIQVKSSGTENYLYEKVRSTGRGIYNPIAIAIQLALLAEKLLITVCWHGKAALTIYCC
jgi:hypothetical protein